MTKFSGKTINVWIVIEASPGAGGVPDTWFKWNELSLQNKVTHVMDESSLWNIVDVADTEISSEYAEWGLWGNVAPISIGWLLYLIFWQAPVTTGAGPIYDHTFELLNANTQQTAGITIERPTDELQHTLSYVENMTISAEIDGYVTVSMNVKGKKWTVVTHTASFTDEKAFVANMLKLYVADEWDNPLLDPNICLKSFELVLTRDQEEDRCMSDIAMGEQITNKFIITGSFEVTMEDSDDMDDYCNNQYKAISIVIENADSDILTFTMPKAVYVNRTPAMSLDAITKQTIEFKGLYSTSESKAINAVLENTLASYV